MTLAEFAVLVGAPSKWVLNTAAILGVDHSYSLELARRFAVMRVLHEDLRIPLVKAHELAGQILEREENSPGLCFIPAAPESEVVVGVDVHRIMASLHVRRSALRTLGAPRRRGRPSLRRDPLDAAREWGLDLSLLQANLRRTPAERLRQLDGMVRFSRRVRRDPARTVPKPG